MVPNGTLTREDSARFRRTGETGGTAQLMFLCGSSGDIASTRQPTGELLGG
ncbi:MAG: hypothetical protein QOH94_2406, partial [Mycobacterium sp.]|nr:hypothetical protein [Mycobacterium sp.]